MAKPKKHVNYQKSKYHNPKYRPRAWLWWMAFLFLIGGAGLYCYFTEIAFDPTDNSQMKAIISVVIAGIGIGVCTISATAHLWFR
ncbi:MAG: hypothetical protein ACI9TH_002343 [Kiritimatiellia bacterium]|jgi:hypothetical protein